MSTHSRLYQLRSWLTLEDAASHLSTLLTEQVSPKDILQLGLEKHLTLSVLLAPTGAIKGKITSLMDTPVALPTPDSPSLLGVVTNSETERKAAKEYGRNLGDIFSLNPDLKEAVDKGELVIWPLTPQLSSDEFVTWSGDVVEVEGLWDLPMLSAERACVQELYQKLIKGPEIVIWELDGAWIMREGDIYCLQQRRPITTDSDEIMTLEECIGWENRHAKPDKWCSLDRLPDDSQIVMRRQHLDAFIASFEEQAFEQVNESEGLRPSHFLTIAALLDLLKNNERFNYNQELIIQEIEHRQKGVRGLSEDNLKKIFSTANNALKEARKSRPS